MPLFGREKVTLVKLKKKEIPVGLWSKCPDCGAPLYKKELENNLNICSKCDFHLSLSSHKRIELLIDKRTFKESNAALTSVDPLKFKGPKTYIQKIESDQKATGLREAVITGQGKINGKDVVIAVTDSRFIIDPTWPELNYNTCYYVNFAPINNYYKDSSLPVRVDCH